LHSQPPRQLLARVSSSVRRHAYRS
jgi:hypothetical protein